MAFTLPQFNLECDIYTGPYLSRVLRLEAVECNLAYSRRAHEYGLYPLPAASHNGLVGTMALLLPAGTDVRSFPLNPVSDMVEVPRLSGRWYAVYTVDDAGKGFDNEHRVAQLAQASATIVGDLYAGLVWPVPMT